MEIATTFANYDEQCGGIVPTSAEVSDALYWMGFNVGTVSMIGLNRWQSVGEYAVQILGEADSDPLAFQQKVLAAFCEQAQILSLKTKDRDIYLSLRLIA